jgi:hypothetical protein
MQTNKTADSTESVLAEAKSKSEIIESVFDLTSDDVERLK